MKKIKIALLVITIIISSLFLYKIYEIYSFASNEPLKSDAILILGCRVKGEEPSVSLQRRMETGLDLYRKGFGDKIILSGGQGSGESITEAEAMRRFYTKNNVSESDLIIEDKSTSTYENFLYSKKLMEKEGIKKIVVVSNGYHLLRASKIANNMDIDSTYKGFVLEDYIFVEIKGVLREVLASFKYMIMNK